MTNRPPLSSIVKSGRLSFFGHFVRMDENADASQVIVEHTRMTSLTLSQGHQGHCTQKWPVWPWVKVIEVLTTAHKNDQSDLESRSSRTLHTRMTSLTLSQGHRGIDDWGRHQKRPWACRPTSELCWRWLNVDVVAVISPLSFAPQVTLEHNSPIDITRIHSNCYVLINFVLLISWVVLLLRLISFTAAQSRLGLQLD